MCMLELKALVRLHVWADYSEPPIFADAINTKIWCADTFDFYAFSSVMVVQRTALFLEVIVVLYFLICSSVQPINFELSFTPTGQLQVRDSFSTGRLQVTCPLLPFHPQWAPHQVCSLKDRGGLLTLCILMDSFFWFDTINLG